MDNQTITSTLIVLNAIVPAAAASSQKDDYR